MRKLLIAAAAAAILAGPATAREDRIFDEEMDARIAAAIPPPGQIEAMAPAIDRMTGALLGLDVGPILDAADPGRRHYDRRGRTLRDIAGRDDPGFEHRLRASIYGTAAGMDRMLDAIAAAAPAMRRSLGEMERELARALREPPRRADPRDREWDEEPYFDAPYDRYED